MARGRTLELLRCEARGPGGLLGPFLKGKRSLPYTVRRRPSVEIMWPVHMLPFVRWSLSAVLPLPCLLITAVSGV